MDEHSSQEKMEAQACCVCGKKTNDRCSACYEGGTSLFFCSREHQKLIWPAHKRVCGPSSTPFLYPPLNAAEAAFAKETLQVAVSVGGRRPMTLVQKLGESADDSRYIIDTVTEGPAMDASLARANYGVLTIIRTHNWACHSQQRCYPTVFEFLARLETELDTYLPSDPPLLVGHASWLSDLRHKALVAFRVEEVAHYSDLAGDTMLYVQRAYQAAYSYISSVVAVEAGTDTAVAVRTALFRILTRVAR